MVMFILNIKGGFYMRKYIPSLIVGISIIIFAFIFLLNQDKPHHVVSADQVNSQIKTYSNQVLTKEDLAQLLTLTVDELDQLISEQKAEKQQLNSYDTYQFIPTIEIKGKTLFLESEIFKWLEYLSTNQ